MVRTLLTPDKQNISIQIPKDFIGKRVEVIAFTVEEAQELIASDKTQTHLASQAVLAKDWLSPEEDKAWESL